MSLELNSCFLIDYRLWAAKSEGRQWVEHCIEQCIEHPPEPRSGLCPEWLADFRIPNLLGARRGAEGSFLCSLVADFLAEGAGWGASPGRGGELGCHPRALRFSWTPNCDENQSEITVSVGEERRDGRGRWSAKRKTAAAVLARQVLKKIVRLASAFCFRPPFRSSFLPLSIGRANLDSFPDQHSESSMKVARNLCDFSTLWEHTRDNI